jgi:NADPH:quinone reductase-like Zn-dependent oxidoreductase
MHPYCGTAAIYAKGKGAHGIHVTQGPRFVPGSTKVILKVLAAGINPVDYKIPEIKGYRGGAGLDVCGEVCTRRDGGRVWGVSAQRGGRREKVEEKDRCSRRKKM